MTEDGEVAAFSDERNSCWVEAVDGELEGANEGEVSSGASGAGLLFQ